MVHRIAARALGGTPPWECNVSVLVQRSASLKTMSCTWFEGLVFIYLIFLCTTWLKEADSIITKDLILSVFLRREFSPLPKETYCRCVQLMCVCERFGQTSLSRCKRKSHSAALRQLLLTKYIRNAHRSWRQAILPAVLLSTCFLFHACAAQGGKCAACMCE